MLLNKKHKISLLLVVFLVFMIFTTCRYLGPGAGDYSESLINGYGYHDAGHFERTIVFSEGEFARIVVDARVDDYLLKGNNLYVARRPRLIYRENGITKSRLAMECEYWVVNTVSHDVSRTDRAYGLACK